MKYINYNTKKLLTGRTLTINKELEDTPPSSYDNLLEIECPENLKKPYIIKVHTCLSPGIYRCSLSANNELDTLKELGNKIAHKRKQGFYLIDRNNDKLYWSRNRLKNFPQILVNPGKEVSPIIYKMLEEFPHSNQYLLYNNLSPFKGYYKKENLWEKMKTTY